MSSPPASANGVSTAEDRVAARSEYNRMRSKKAQQRARVKARQDAAAMKAKNRGRGAQSAWARGSARGAKGDVGSYNADLVMSVNHRNRDSGLHKHKDLKANTGAWVKGVKRGAKGDAGSYNADLVMSVNQRDRDSGVLKHGESEIKTGALDQEGAWSKSVKRGAQGDAGLRCGGS